MDPDYQLFIEKQKPRVTILLLLPSGNGTSFVIDSIMFFLSSIRIALAEHDGQDNTFNTMCKKFTISKVSFYDYNHFRKPYLLDSVFHLDNSTEPDEKNPMHSFPKILDSFFKEESKTLII
jgi:hypothetical protein